MSTRRARIKAVTSLPPRRKNVEHVENKNKSNTPKDEAEKSAKSPRTPRSAAGKNIDGNEKHSPAPKLLPPLIPIISNSPNISKVPSNVEKVSPLADIQKEPIKTLANVEKVPVITATGVSKPVFASPHLRRDSPDRRRIVSPLTPSSRLNKAVVKATPQHVKTTSLIENASQNGNNCSDAHSDSEGRDKPSSVDDNYNIPSIPESVNDEAVMDGIVPLQPTRNVPKPIDQLKNEIISEHAEVLFDPIVPLPSPSKVRPKLRPVPRLGPHRRNSIQGSASESEDESRRALLNSGSATPAPPRQRHDSHTSHSTQQSVTNRDVNRIRNDSVCSSVSQATMPLAPATSPTKEKQVSRSRRHESNRRMVAMRRRYDSVKKEKLTMYDLIFCNPTNNPIVPNEDEMKAQEANQKEAAKAAEADEREADNPPEANEAPVPQIKLGPNGEIVLDEQSLVIKQTDSKRKLSSVVHEGSWSGSGGRYTRAPRTGEWTESETVRFYRALAAVGTDFMLMAPLFPDRNRRDLYLKFKKEEKLNIGQVDKALRSGTRWDVTRLQEEFATERAEEAVRAKRAVERLRLQRRRERARVQCAKEITLRQSRGSKALGTSVMPSKEDGVRGVDELVERAIENKKRTSKRNKAKAPTNVQTDAMNLTTPNYATLTLIGNNATQDGGPGIHEQNRPRNPPETNLNAVTPHNYTTLTLINNQKRTPGRPPSVEMATLSRVDPLATKVPSLPSIPSNIEAGSLVVLTVEDPKSPTKKMLQTYIARGPGQLTPIALPETFLNSVVGYMKKGTPKSNVSTGSSPQLTSPSSVASQDSRTNTPSVIQVNPSPSKRQRHSSYNITQL